MHVQLVMCMFALMLLLVAGEKYVMSTKVTLSSVPLYNDGCSMMVNTTNGSREIDLRKLRAQRYQFNNTEQGISYTWNVCPLRAADGEIKECHNHNFVSEKDGKCVVVGNYTKFKKDGDKMTVATHRIETDKIEGATIILNCSYADEQKLECNNLFHECSGSISLKFVFSAKQFCFEEESRTVQATPINPHNGGNSHRDWVKLSPGSIGLIAAGCVILVYMILGLAHGIGKGEKGLNRLPNSDFWLELPFVVKDGAMFIFRGCRLPPGTVIYSPIIEDKTSPIADV